MLVLSCTTRSFPEMPLDRALMRLTWAGFRAVELFLPAGEKPLPEAEALSSLLQATEVRVAALDAGRLRGEEREAAMDAAAHVGRCAVLARQLGCNRVVCDLEIGSEPLARETVTDLLNALAEVPVLICFRNRFDDGPDARERLFSLIAASPDRLGLALDPGAACRSGWDFLAEWLNFGRTVRHVYGTDARGSSLAALGTGDVPWEAVGERLLKDDYSGAVSLWVRVEAFRDPLYAEAEVKEARFMMETWFDGAE
jgi:sugar phosphate isomerase/epimerase